MTNNTSCFYHASNIGGLTELLPQSKMHGDTLTVCYFTPNRAYALFYLRDMEINHVTCSVDDNGVVVYHEQFPNQLAAIYGNRCGYIYICDDHNKIKQGHTGGVWVATEPVKILRKEFINDVYNKIIKAEQSGEIRVNRYEDLSDEKKAKISEMMKQSILKNGLLYKDTKKSQFFKPYFSSSWKAAEESEA
jgi:hypothetical protein